jgi:hypothetical protein
MPLMRAQAAVRMVVVDVIIAAGGVSAGLSPLQAKQASTIDCEIRMTAQSGAVRLSAMTGVRKPASGQYRFEVSKSSPIGTSQSAQSGAFDLEAGQETLLTTVVIEEGAVGHYTAKLILDTDLGSTSCVSP